MKRLFLLSAVVVALCLAAGASSLSFTPMIPQPNNGLADLLYNGNFPTAGDAYCSFTNGCGTIPLGGQTAYMWTAGDFVISSTFTNTGITSATDLSVNFMVQDFLGGGNNETVFYYVNNVAVAQFTVLDCGFCGNDVLVTGMVNFSDIAPINGGYTLEMILQNTIPGGGGSIAFLDGGTFTLSGSGGTTPEPSSMILLGSGILAAAGVLRRKISR